MALKRAVSIGASSCQIFVKNNMQWLGKPYPPCEIEAFKRERKSSGLAAVFGHAGYLINLGAPPGPNRDKSIQSLIQEIELATSIGLPFLVLHPGAHLGAGEAAGLDQIVAAIDEVFRATRSSNVRLALENTAGQGSCLGNKISHLAAIFDRVKQSRRLGICLDTCHFLAAGYDIRTPQGWDHAIGEVDSMIGLKQILAFHLNDSKSPLGSRVDRHAHIGQGQLGAQAFRHLVNDPRFASSPGCIETPKSADLHEDVENLAVLRSLAAGRGGASNKPAAGKARPKARA